MAATKRPATTAAMKDAPAKSAEAKPNEPTPEAPPTKPAAPPPTPTARPLFTGPDGKTLSGVMAVLQILDRYGAESGELAGLPRRLELVGTFATASHTAAAGMARETGVLAADADAVTLTARFVSVVEQPAEEPEPAA